MKPTKNALIFLLFVAMATLLLLAACGQTTASGNTQPASGQVTAADGQTLMQERCTSCHGTQFSQFHMSASQWKRTVDQMMARGAQLNQQEEQVLVTYLAQTY
jgi:hypothetical protein